MKPNFALNITDTAISLLHRTSQGWLEVGQAAFDSPDLEAELGYLRSSALGLSPQGFTTKLVLPPSQIRYLEIDAPGPDKAARETQIRSALEGRTPYDVDELVFDWWGTGPKVQVAVVARETLEEAEGFADAHRLNPVSFVTIPAEGQFAGEPWFGTSGVAATLMPEGEKVTRDQDPVKIITRDAPKGSAAQKPEPAAEVPTGKADAATEDAVEQSATAAAVADADDAEKPAAKAEAEKAAQDAERAADAKQEALEAARTAQEAEAEAKKLADEAAAKRRADEAEAKRVAEEAEAARKIEAAKAEMELRAQQLAQAEAKRLVEEAERNKAAMEARAASERAKAALIEAEQKRASSDTAAAEVARAAFEGVTDPGIADTDTPTPPAPTFASRRRDEGGAAPALGPAKSAAQQVTANAPAVAPVAGAATAEKPKPGGLTAPTITSVSAGKTPAQAAPTAPTVKAVPKPLNGTPSFATGAKPELGKPTKAAMVTAERIPGKSAALSRFKSKVKEATLPPTAASSASGDQTMGKFGAKLQPQRGKPRFLGLILTLILLAVLAVIAAWSSIYVSRNTGADAPVQVASGIQTPTDDSGTAQILAEMEADAEIEAELPTDVTAEVQAEAETDVAAEVQAEAEAELIPEAEIVTEAPTGLAGPAGPGPAVSAEGTVAQVAVPGRGPQDEIFLAAIDGQPPAFDAVALPKPQARPDAAPAAAMPPPPFGTQYEFEADGSIKATANGVVMPDGFWLIAAKPPVLPPARLAEISDPVAPAAEATATPPPGSAASDAAAASTSGIATMTGPTDAANPATADTTAEGTGPSSAFVQDTTVENRRPRGRPASLSPPDLSPAATDPAAADPAQADPAQAEDDAALPDPALSRLTSLRPRARPQSVVAAAQDARKAAEAASLAARAAAEEKTASATATEATLVLSPRPAARPRDFSKAVAAAVSAATRETTRSASAKTKEPAPSAEPEEQDEPEVKVSAAPRIPTRANVAKQATFKNAINLSKINLIGVYGTDSKRYALIRTSSGRYQKVRVGDRVDGGTVAAITRNEVRYKKGSKMLSLSMPKG